MFFESLVNLPPVIDFEASGLDSSHSYPISAGLVVNGHSHYWVIKPKHDWRHWNDSSELIHGLSRDYLLENGLPSHIVCKEMQSILANHKFVYSDEPFWDRFWAARLGLRNLRIPDVRGLLKPGKVNKLSTKIAHFRRSENLTPHHAEHDAIAIAMAANFLMS